MKQHLFILPNFQYGGTEKNVVILCNFLEQLGRNYFVFSLGAGGDLRIPPHRVRYMDKFSYFHALFGVFRFLRSSDFDVVHLFGEVPVSFILFLKFAFRNIQFVAHVRNSERHFLSTIQSSFRRKFVFFLLKYSIEFSDFTFSNSLKLSRDTEAFFHTSKNILTLFNTTSCLNINSEVIPDKKRIVLIGRGVDQKDYFASIEVLRRYFDIGGRCNIEIFGDFAPDFVKLLLDALGTHSARVSFKGFSNDPWNDADDIMALLMTSKYEGSPNVLLEAMERGVPAVCFDFDYGPSELLVGVHLEQLIIRNRDVVAAAEKLSCLEDIRNWCVFSSAVYSRAQEFERKTILGRFFCFLEG